MSTETKARAPSGARRVAHGFMDALDDFPATKQREVARAALGMVREMLTDRRAMEARLNGGNRKPSPSRVAPTMIRTVSDAKPRAKTAG